MPKLTSHRSHGPRETALNTGPGSPPAKRQRWVNHFALLAILVLVIAGCGKGGSESASATSAPGASVTDASVPPTEGTGPGPTLPPTHGSSVQVAGLPIGDGHADVNGNDECVHVFWAGFVQPGNTFEVTGTVEAPNTNTSPTDTTGTTSLSGGHFVSIDAATACGGGDPTAPACIGHQFDSTVNPPTGLNCLTGVRWVGGPGDSSETWSLALTGELRCPAIDSAQACRATGLPADKQSTTQTSVELTPPTGGSQGTAIPTSTTASSDTTSPSDTSSLVTTSDTNATGD